MQMIFFLLFNFQNYQCGLSLLKQNWLKCIDIILICFTFIPIQTNSFYLWWIKSLIFIRNIFKQTSNESVWYKVWYFFWKSIISNVRIFVNFCLYGLWLSSIQRIDRLLMMKQHDAIFMPHARKTQAKNTFLVIWDQKCQL